MPIAQHQETRPDHRKARSKEAEVPSQLVLTRMNVVDGEQLVIAGTGAGDVGDIE